MKLQTAIKQATKHLLASEKARTYYTGPDVWGEVKSYTLEFERSDGYPNELVCTTWGFDYEIIVVPQSRPELIKHKCLSQMGTSPLAQVARRYYLDILRRESNS